MTFVACLANVLGIYCYRNILLKTCHRIILFKTPIVESLNKGLLSIKKNIIQKYNTIVVNGTLIFLLLFN